MIPFIRRRLECDVRRDRQPVGAAVKEILTPLLRGKSGPIFSPPGGQGVDEPARAARSEVRQSLAGTLLSSFRTNFPCSR
jgi:hypothetical protein